VSRNPRSGSAAGAGMGASGASAMAPLPMASALHEWPEAGRTFWTLRRVADALRTLAPTAGVGTVSRPVLGHVVSDMPIARIWTDTRTVEPGDCFVALKGERFDGADFAAEAVARGARAVVTSDARRVGALGVPVLEVTDTLAAYGALARYRRAAWPGIVIAVGGSNGKTSTKELVRAALGARLEVHATSGNLNNQVGAPQTLLALPDAAHVAVVEVGTNTPGEIEILRDIVCPDMAIVTCIAEEHLEGFGDLAGVLREEAALLDGVALAIVPAAEAALVAEAKRRAKAVLTVGLGQGELAATSHGLGPDGRGTMTVDGVAVSVPLRGAHSMANAMFALAAARACGVSLDDAARGLARLDAGAVPGMRSAVEPIADCLLVNDAYNANPGSARAAIALLDAVAGGRARVIVLGTMRELGAASDSAHDDIARAAVASGAELVAGIGEFAPALSRVAPGHAGVVTAHDVDDLWPTLERRLPARAAILLKASRGVRLERMVPLIRAWAEENESPYATPSSGD